MKRKILIMVILVGLAGLFFFGACGGGGSGNGSNNLDSPLPGDVVINEIFYDVPIGGDANCDGIWNFIDDEFVEIVNVSADTLMFEGAKLADADTVRHIFAANTDLPAGKALVIFGGGSPACSWSSDVIVVTASTGSLGLNPTGDTITLLDSLNLPFIFASYNGSILDESITLDPDLNDLDPDSGVVDGFVAHSTVAGSSTLYSPGTKTDGTLF